MATVKSKQVQTVVLLDAETLVRIDTLASREELSRADIIRRLIRLGMKLEPEIVLRKVG